MAFVIWSVFPVLDSLKAYMSASMIEEMHESQLLSFLKIDRAGWSFWGLFLVLAGYTAMTRFNVGDIKTAASHFHDAITYCLLRQMRWLRASSSGAYRQ